LTQGDEIWQDGRPGWVAGHLPFWCTLAQGLARQGQNVHNFGNTHLVEPGVTNWPMTMIGMWGYTPVWITGILILLKFAQETCFDATV